MSKKGKTTEADDPNHHLGKHTGYELIDGQYHIAPAYIEQFDKLYYQKIGIREMLKTISAHVAKDLEDIIKEEHKLWERIGDDIGIGLSKERGWTYRDGIISKLEKPPVKEM